MRIICIQSSTAKKFEFNNEEDEQRYMSALNLTSFKTLPRGVIRCICLISNAFVFSDIDNTLVSKWAVGPYCYKIVDVVYIEARHLV